MRWHSLPCSKSSSMVADRYVLRSRSQLSFGVFLLLEHSLAVAGSLLPGTIHVNFLLVRGHSIPECVTSKLEDQNAALLLHCTSLVNFSALSLVYSGVHSWWILQLLRILYYFEARHMCSWYAPTAPAATTKKASTFSTSPFGSSFGSSMQATPFKSHTHSCWSFCSNSTLEETSSLEREN